MPEPDLLQAVNAPLKCGQRRVRHPWPVERTPASPCCCTRRADPWLRGSSKFEVPWLLHRWKWSQNCTKETTELRTATIKIMMILMCSLIACTLVEVPETAHRHHKNEYQADENNDDPDVQPHCVHVGGSTGELQRSTYEGTQAMSCVQVFEWLRRGKVRDDNGMTTMINSGKQNVKVLIVWKRRYE